MINSVVVMHLRFKWDRFELLQHISLEGRLRFGYDLLAIADSKSLKLLSIGTVEHDCTISSNVMIKLVHDLALAGITVNFTWEW